ncbi:MAG: hypothetical protein HYX53_08515 [Chloroflexi bacterium]|nr:hypothetical protein [Chloroflexota bacterium]
MRILSVRVVGILAVVVLAAIVVAVVVAFTAGGGHDEPANATPSPDTTSPEAVTERFFHWYATERSLGRDPMAAGALDANPDVTKDFVASMASASAMAQPGVDAMCTTAIPHDFTQEKATVSGDNASVKVAATDLHSAWKVDLKREGSSWRINAVTCATG